MIAWRRESEAGRPWATWGLLAATLIGAGASPDVHARFGLLPADPRLAALLGHLFVHAGLLSLLGTLLFAAAAGPWLEARLGRGLLLASYLAAGLAGAALFAALSPDAEARWLGGWAAVAGWLGLLAVAARGAPADLLGVAAGRAGSLLAPAWAPAALWLGAQLASLVTGDAASAAAQAGSFGFGAVLALGLERSGVIERAALPAPAAGARGERPRGAAKAVKAARSGPLPSRPEHLEALLGDSPDPAVARAYLARSAAEGRRESARAVVAERFLEALEFRRRDPAVALWGALVATGPTPELTSDKALQLASWARAASASAEHTAALHAALRGADAAAAAQIARSARRSDPVICYRAAERALAGPALGASDQAALEGLRLEAEREVAARGVILVPDGVAAPPPAARAAASSPAAPEPRRVTAPAPARPLAIGEAIELAPEPALAPPPPAALPDPERSGEAAFLDAFHAALHEEEPKPDAPRLRTLRVREARPRGIEGDSLVLEVPERGAIRLPLTRIHAVALAGVRGLSERAGDKPVLLVDLCLSAEGEPELQVLRLRSDRFDPRRVAPSAETSPLQALRAFVGALAAAAHAPLLPADDVAGEAPLRIFRDLASYQREVLGAA
jgi:membrane associated rhomboid family serine protease